MKVIEKYAGAVNSTNLKDDEHHHNTDVLAAVALTTRLGSNLLRAKYAGIEASTKPLMDDWKCIILKRAIREGWTQFAEEVALISLWYWLEPICETCKGREHPKIPNTPMLEMIVCPTCGGTGRKPLECVAEIQLFVRDGVEQLESMCREAASKANHKLR